ncbi:MAG: DUF87 domain-containing protein [Candidatus Lernaella stagnicola]|nr:DUF87 domain-containing protein [Candidatus Lernaella stagnicola]
MTCTLLTEILNTDSVDLNKIAQGLLFAKHGTEALPFSFPKYVVQTIKNTPHQRVRGRTDWPKAEPPYLPESVLASFHAIGSRLVFVLRSDGNIVHVSLGTDAERERLLHDLVTAEIGAPERKTERDDLPWDEFRHIRLLFGVPRWQKDDSPPIADVLLDSLRSLPFTYVFLAVPVPPETLAKAARQLQRTAQTIDQNFLKIGEKADADRRARQALDLVDAHRVRVERGLQAGMWRVVPLVMAATETAADLAASVLAGCLRHEPEKPEDDPLPIRSCLVAPAGSATTAEHLDTWLFSDEAARLCPLPLRDRPGFCVSRAATFDVDPIENEGETIEIASIMDGERITPNRLELPIDQFARHCVVVGNTGSGKTNTIQFILVHLARRNIPFLVIEPAKSEYRGLAAHIPGLTRFRLGAVPDEEGELPLFFNPFFFPEGFPLHTHIDYLKNTFIASFGLFPPAPYLLETALYRVYEERGWDIVTGRHLRGRDRLAFPTMTDLLEQIDPVVEAAQYHDEITRNLKGALKTRIGNLCVGPKGLCLNSGENVPCEVLFDSPTLIEIKDMGSDEEKALLMGLILTRLYEYRVAAQAGPQSHLRHLLVVEEAHRLLRRVQSRSSEEGDMQGKAIETFVNIVAEVRAYGQGVLVGEQLPSKLAADVVKNACTKIVHRLGPKEDRDFVGDMMVLLHPQKQALANLRVGQAVIHGEPMDGAMRVMIDCFPPSGTPATRKQKPDAVGPDLLQRYKTTLFEHRFEALWSDATFQADVNLFFFQLICGEDPDGALNLLKQKAGDLLVDHDRHDDGRFLGAVIRQALRRRALHYGWSEKEFDAMCEAARKFHGFPERLRERLVTKKRAFPFCRLCPQRCAYGYEVGWLTRDPMFRTAFSMLFDAPNRDMSFEEEAMAFVGDWFQTELETLLLPPPALAACVIAHGCRAAKVTPGRINRTFAELVSD